MSDHVKTEPLSEAGNIVGILQAAEDSFVVTFIDHTVLDGPIVLKIDEIATLKKMVSFLTESIAVIEDLDEDTPKELVQTDRGLEKKKVKVGISPEEIDQLYKREKL